MRKFKNTHYLLQLIIILLSQWTVAFAQKLPKVQTSSIRAPKNIKIDGKTTEWNDQFQAYNWGNHIYYTLSNDDDNLYLTAKMDDILGSRKILKGGLTFTIVPSSKKANELSITFPDIDKPVMDTEEHDGTPLLRYASLRSKPNTAANKAKIDSLIASANKNMAKTYKQIYITGMPGISDSLLSIYNAKEIMVGAGYDNDMNYTYELAIPLKYLQTALNDAKSIKYNIKLNTVSPIILKKAMAMPPRVLSGPPGPPRPSQPGSLDDQFFFNNTDFSGEYTLAQKQ